MEVKLELLYRDASNYKTSFDHLVNSDEYPEVLLLTTDSQITMGEYGTKTEADFFESDIHPHRFEPEYDHNILEIQKIVK